MDHARDLGRVEVWEESLKRSLERRGQPRRSSVELHRLRPERDLTLGDVLQRSASYSELRRKAAQRTAMPRPSVALGGISALALVAGATVPGLLGGASASRKQRVAYAADAHAKAKSDAAVRGSWGSFVAAGGGSAEAAGSSAGSHAAAVSHASRDAAARASVTHSANGGAVAHTASATSEAAGESVTSHSGGVAVSPGAVAQPTVAENTRLVSDATSVQNVSPATQSRPQTASAGTAVTPSGEGVVTPSTGTVVTSKPSTPPTVVQERPAPPGSVEGVSGGVPTRTTPPTTTPTTPTTPTRTPTRTGTSAPTTTPTTTTGNTSPAPNVQQGVNRMIAAGNQIATRPYVYGGGHGSFNSNGYDCSGSVSYVLHAAGLLSSPEDSTELESYGQPGTGKYVSIYANSGHAWMTIQGRRFDTVALAENGSRWSNHMVSTSGFVARHPKGY